MLVVLMLIGEWPVAIDYGMAGLSRAALLNRSGLEA